MFNRRTRRPDGRPRFGDRRTAKRQAAGWQSRYRVVDQAREHVHYADDDFEPCVLLDLSVEGAGLHVTDGDVAVGDHVELDLPLGPHKRASIHLRAEVRHASVDDDASRAVLEFVEVGDLERALLQRLLRDLNHDTSQSA